MTRKIRMKREAVEHRPDGTGRRRYEGTEYQIGDAPDQVSEGVAMQWMSAGTADEVIPTRNSKRDIPETPDIDD